MRDRLRRDLLARLTKAIGTDGLIGGQVVDLASTGETLELDALEYIHSHKTGALFIAAAQMGAVVSRAGSSVEVSHGMSHTGMVSTPSTARIQTR